MIELGIIGVANPDFREKYAPLLLQLPQKIRVTAIYDPVVRRAEMAALQLEAEIETSFEKLIRRHNVDAILFLSPGWQGLLPLLSCLQLRKPVFCSRTVWKQPRLTAPLERLTQQQDGLIVLENRFRYWPSSLRCRELIATQLGKPQLLKIKVLHDSGREQVHQVERAELLDWGRFLLQCSLIRKQATNQDELTIEYYRERNGEIRELIPMTLTEQYADTDITDINRIELRLNCEQGELWIMGPSFLSWRLDSAPEEQWREEHLREQSELLRQFDHFFRRVAGGLIPVHDISDRFWAEQAETELFDA